VRSAIENVTKLRAGGAERHVNRERPMCVAAVVHVYVTATKFIRDWSTALIGPTRWGGGRGAGESGSKYFPIWEVFGYFDLRVLSCCAAEPAGSSASRPAARLEIVGTPPVVDLVVLVVHPLQVVVAVHPAGDPVNSGHGGANIRRCGVWVVVRLDTAGRPSDTSPLVCAVLCQRQESAMPTF